MIRFIFTILVVGCGFQPVKSIADNVGKASEFTTNTLVLLRLSTNWDDFGITSDDTRTTDLLNMCINYVPKILDDISEKEREPVPLGGITRAQADAFRSRSMDIAILQARRDIAVEVEKIRRRIIELLGTMPVLESEVEQIEDTLRTP